MKTVLVYAILILLAGCSAAPSMRYCDEVHYDREGTKVKLTAVCQVPAGGALPGTGF